jgi:hypothetical protein
MSASSHRLTYALVAALLCSVAATGAFAQSFTTFDVKGSGTSKGQGTVAYATNAAGVSAGLSLDAGDVAHGFVRAANGKITKFDAPGAGTKGFHQGTAAKAINSDGTIAGYLIDANGVNHGFVRDSGKKGAITEFDAPQSGTGNGQGTIAYAIDDAGDVAGAYFDSGSVIHGFVRYARKGKITTFDASGAGTGFGQGTQANGIAANGAITGMYTDAGGVNHGFLRDDSKKGKITTFDVTGAGTADGQGTIANAINMAGTIAGEYYDATGANHGFVRAANGKITKFDAPGSGSGKGQGTVAYSINDDGVIAGAFFDSDFIGHGFVRDAHGTITTFDAPGAGTSYGEGTDALAIDASGDIAGFLRDSSDVYHGYVRTP